MKYTHVKFILIMISIVISLCIPAGIQAKNTPLAYTISAPNIIKKKNTITLEWYQTQPVLVTVYKLSYTRKLPNNCGDIDTLPVGASCLIVWQNRNLVGNIRVSDKFYRIGDQYFIQQNVYQTHNGGYGPFSPK